VKCYNGNYVRLRNILHKHNKYQQPRQLPGRMNTRLDLNEIRTNFGSLNTHFEALGIYMTPVDNFRDLWWISLSLRIASWFDCSTLYCTSYVCPTYVTRPISTISDIYLRTNSWVICVLSHPLRIQLSRDFRNPRQISNPIRIVPTPPWTSINYKY